MTIHQYLDAVCAQIKCREVHEAVRAELESHIRDRSEALQSQGLSAEQALAAALKQMGDPADVGAGFHRIHRPRTDWALMGATVALVAAGIGAMYAIDASQQIGYGPKQAIYALVGLVACAWFFWFDYGLIRTWGWPLWLLPGFFGWPTPPPLIYLPGLAALFARWRWDDRWASGKAVAVGVVPVAAYILFKQASDAMSTSPSF